MNYKQNDFINQLKAWNTGERINIDQIKMIKSHLNALKDHYPQTLRIHIELIARVFGPDDIYELFYDIIDQIFIPEIDEDGPSYYGVFANYIGYDGIKNEEIHENYHLMDVNKYKG